MKNLTSVLLAVLMCVGLYIPAVAATSETVEVIGESETVFKADGEEFTLKNKDGDVLIPIYYDSTVFYPVTVINSVKEEKITITGNPQRGEKVDAKIYKNYSVIIDGEETELKKPFAKVDAELYPILYKGTWYLPNTILGYVKYSDGTIIDNCGVDKNATWDSKEKTITITTVGTAPTVKTETSNKESSKPEKQVQAKSSAAVTTGEKNALAKAYSDLNYTAFSHSGLIKQLEYEKFSNEEATYAADNCGADWSEQAAQKALSYLDYTAFSYSGLIKQLEYEGYTNTEATYGVDNCGANWNEQAAKKAKSYLDYSSFSRSRLIEQLEYEGFTREQAEFGAAENGY
jgi:hypothetical protein